MPPAPLLPFSAGDTFLLKSPSSAKLHLYIALCDPFRDPPMVLTVPLNTVTTLTDRTVLLQPGDHPFIRHETAVSYDLMTLLPTAQLSQLAQINAGAGEGDRTFVKREPLRGNILGRIIAGALTSDLAPKRMVKELKARLGVADGGG